MSLRRRLHELFHPGMSFIPGWLASHPGMSFISVSGHLPLSVHMIWSKNVFAPGWFHPGAEDRDEIIPGRTHFCSKSCKHFLQGWNTSRDEITHVNGALLRDVMIGILKEEMDLVNCVIILGKNYFWTCRQKVIKPSFSHFKRILVNKYETEKHIANKLNKAKMFRKKWKLFEKFFSSC